MRSERRSAGSLALFAATATAFTRRILMHPAVRLVHTLSAAGRTVTNVFRVWVLGHVQSTSTIRARLSSALAIGSGTTSGTTASGLYAGQFKLVTGETSQYARNVTELPSRAQELPRVVRSR